MTAILLRGTQTSKSPAVSRRGFAIREIATPRSGIEIAVHAKAELRATVPVNSVWKTVTGAVFELLRPFP
jgi:hypothetical protein